MLGISIAQYKTCNMYMHVAQAQAWSHALETVLQVLWSQEGEVSKKNVHNATGMV